MKKSIKKIFGSILVMGLTAMVFTGCTKSKKVEKKGNDKKVEKESKTDLTKVSSREFARLMGNGINLGNTFEAYGHKSGTDKEVKFYETLWGAPETTQETISNMKKNGFTSIRIPVAWTNKMNFEDGDYKISEDYIKRVKEVVDYALNEDMIVIFNDHWDGGWWGMFGSEDEKKKEAAMELYTSMWEQLSESFKDYDNRVVFEGGNEEIGDRLNDLDEDFNPKGATLSQDECYEKALEINQKFVDIVRASGGNNENRFLLIPGYNTDITMTMDERWKMPTDKADDKLLLSVHYYTPWSYCGGTGDSKWGTKDNYTEMNDLMKKLSKYADDGYGIIIGEESVGPTDDGKEKTNDILWYTNLYANCDYYGYTPMLWDTGNIFDRSSGECIGEDLGKFFKDAYENEKDKSEDEVKSAAKKTMDDALNDAPDTFQEKSKIKAGKDKAIAWIMWNAGDWSLAYSVGDVYKPDETSEGLKATDVEVTGEGTYTVALDFTETANQMSNNCAFSAVGIYNGEDLFPGYIMDIKSVKINGKDYALKGEPYTTADDKHCTRVNLYNSWVNKVPEKGTRTVSGKLDDASPTIIAGDALGEVKTIEVTFDYKPGDEGISKNDNNAKNN
ncbi:MAG: glycoside hydrolase family 5 protein [Lachnospiraceae bacterium]|nr:glycoside hydrolase family 5 protein [Lachnospiraceae bacterium]